MIEWTGLGFALTKRLVELHGGRIWAGADGYLTKPLDARAFRETLRRILTPGAAR